MNFVDNTHVLKIILRIVNDVSQFYNTSRKQNVRNTLAKNLMLRKLNI